MKTDRSAKSETLPTKLIIAEALPNPFNNVVRWGHVLPEAGRVKVGIYDLAGREPARLFDSETAAGRHTLTWLASNAPAGVYFGKVMVAERVATTKLLLVR